MITIENEAKRMHQCDKCGGDVGPANDAYLLEFLATPSIADIAPLGSASLYELSHAIETGMGRHLFPVRNGDYLICQGSSRGESVNDPRRSFHFEYRRAYEELQKIVSEQ
jgi:hypothetical protein